MSLKPIPRQLNDTSNDKLLQIEGACESSCDPFVEETKIVLRERVRQARHSFDLALIMAVIFTAMGLVGGLLLFLGKAQEGTVTTAAGIGSSLHCFQLAKEANDRLDKALAEIQDENL